MTKRIVSWKTFDTAFLAIPSFKAFFNTPIIIAFVLQMGTTVVIAVFSTVRNEVKFVAHNPEINNIGYGNDHDEILQ